jgi:PAS domain S-box-containing protein
MSTVHNSNTGEGPPSPVEPLGDCFNHLSFPACLIGRDGQIIDRNARFISLFESDHNTVRLDENNPFFPEYRRRIAVSYLRALRGQDRQCFAVMKTSAGESLPVEIYLFPLFLDKEVYSILAFLKVVDSRMYSFDRSTSVMMEEGGLARAPVYDYTPFPIIRINRHGDLLYASASFESLTGYSMAEIQKKPDIVLEMLSRYAFEKIRRSLLYILNGKVPFKRVTDIRLKAKGDAEKWVNLTAYPVVRQNEIVAIEIAGEDVTRVKKLEERIGLMNRIQIIGDLTKGLLHSFNNIINIISSKTQLLLQFTEKDVVISGLRVIEKAANEGVRQVRRIEEFIGEGQRLTEGENEDLIDIIEDATEFAKIQFKVEEKERRRFIKISKKYYSRTVVNVDARTLRELFLSMIFRVATHVTREGLLDVELRENGSPTIRVSVAKKDHEAVEGAVEDNPYSGIDIRRVAEKISAKIIEEESASAYSIQLVIPSSLVVRRDRHDESDVSVKVRDLDIVIVEDERELKDILFELFNRMGNRVSVFENGEEALAEIKEGKTDLLITDYQVSGITGLELAARVKEIDDTIITVLFSGWMLNDLKSYKNVVDVFYPKPFKLDALITGIAKLLQARKKDD